MESEVTTWSSWDRMVSTDLLREPEREVRRRFLAETMSLSSKGLGRIELGSEERARSRGSEDPESPSICVMQTGLGEDRQLQTKLGAFAREGPAAGRLQN
jgi:hypothetical protein